MNSTSKIDSKIRPGLVAARLRALRLALKMTKAEFADSFGIDRSSYTKIENGNKPLNIDMGYEISERYGVSLDFIYRGQLGTLPDTLAPFIRAALAS